jgi:signal transduction histidine kinase
MSITLGHRRFSLKQKLIFLPVAAVALTLLAAGLVLVLVIDRLYLDLARQSLAAAAQSLEQRVEAYGRQLTTDARIVARRADLVAVAGMVSRYQDIDNYQPLVFDLEKQRLARVLAGQLALLGHNRVMVCDERGELIAAAERKGGTVKLYAMSYEAGQPRLLTHREEGWQPAAQPPATLAKSCYRRSGLYLGVDEEQIQQQASEPLVRTLADGTKRRVGQVVIASSYTPAQLLSDTTQEGVALAYVQPDGTLKGTFSIPLDAEVRRQLLQGREGGWLQGDRHYLTTLLVESGNGESIRFVLGLNNTLYQEQRRSMLAVLAGVLLFSALIVIPVAAWLANRSVLKPVERLVVNMESIKAGSYQNLSSDRSNDELGRLARAFDAMARAVWQREWELQEYRDHLEQKVEKEVSRRQEQEKMLIRQSRLAAMGEALSSIAHHWRQPLNALGANIQDLPDARAHGELSEAYLQKVSSDSMRLINQMSQTIDAFRNFFRPDAKKEPFSVVDSIERTLSMLRPTLENSRVTIATDFRSDPVVEGYPNEFAQVILHLLSNAVDAMIERQSPVREIRIGVQSIKEGRGAHIEVCDSGGGIEESLIARLFEPYVSTKQKSHGSGIGLYMAKMIIEWNMHGAITFANRNGGACFTIEI